MITDNRAERIKDVVAKRQNDLTIILENVHDPHNIGAVLRTCDSVGIGEIYVILTEEDIPQSRYVGKSSSSGSKKWVDIHVYKNIADCFLDVRKRYKRIFGTHLSGSSQSLYDLELVEPCALLFGNEHDGISKEALKSIDGNFIIPQVGMVKSLNISVPCAVTLYEAFRQRNLKGKYSIDYSKDMQSQYEKYVSITRGLDQ